MSPEVQASLIKVAGNWSQLLLTIEQKQRKAALDGLLKRFDAIYQRLEEKYED